MQLTGADIFLFTFWLTVASFWVPVGWMLMRALTPRVVMERYFKEPHFSQAELTLFSHFPGTLLRTGVFMGACFQERYRRNRRLKDYLDRVPSWYVSASKLFCFAAVGHGALIVVLTAGLVFWPK